MPPTPAGVGFLLQKNALAEGSLPLQSALFYILRLWLLKPCMSRMTPTTFPIIMGFST